MPVYLRKGLLDCVWQNTQACQATCLHYIGIYTEYTYHIHIICHVYAIQTFCIYNLNLFDIYGICIVYVLHITSVYVIYHNINFPGPCTFH
jgi:hypothetical protein